MSIKTQFPMHFNLVLGDYVVYIPRIYIIWSKRFFKNVLKLHDSSILNIFKSFYLYFNGQVLWLAWIINSTWTLLTYPQWYFVCVHIWIPFPWESTLLFCYLSSSGWSDNNEWKDDGLKFMLKGEIKTIHFRMSTPYG